MVYYENIEKLKNSQYIEKSDTKWLGISVSENKFNNKDTVGPIEIQIAKENPSLNEIDYAKINLGKCWIFIFSELIELFNKRDSIDERVKFWTLGKLEKINKGYFIITLYCKKGERLSINIKQKSVSGADKVFVMYFNTPQFYSFVRKIVSSAAKIIDFNINIKNIIDPEKNLLIKRSNKHNSTLLCLRNGIILPDVFLSESDKKLLQYSCESRLFYDEWLSVHGEKINVSNQKLLTTIDGEFILEDKEELNGSFVALAILSSLVFKVDCEDKLGKE